MSVAIIDKNIKFQIDSRYEGLTVQVERWAGCECEYMKPIDTGQTEQAPNLQ
jgi:hypothetical protein